jgi:T-complex protein 1 subunit eta
MMQPSIILLREGTDTSQGRPQLISNINACQAIVDTVRTTLGPRGMDKLIVNGNKVTISNDGATIMKLLDIVHPAAQTLVDIAKSQDEEVGDGTTTVVVLAGELLKQAKVFVEDGMHSQIIIRGLRAACQLAKDKINQLAVPITTANEAEKRKMLEKCAGTALNSKLVAGSKDFFAKMIVDAVLQLDQSALDLSSIGIKKESGGGLEDSQLLLGVAFKKSFSYAGFEQQPKCFEKPKILLLNLELELKSEKENAEIRIEDPSQYQKIVDAEWDIINEKLDKIHQSGAKVILSRLAIGDLATQFFADRDIFCAGRVPEEDMKRVAKAVGGQIQTTVQNLIPSVIGTCGLFEEKQIGKERYNFFTKCSDPKATTFIIRGGGEQFLDEAERSIHDSIMVVRRAIRHGSVVAGGGAIEMELSRHLWEHARGIEGKQQLIIAAVSKALEIIPFQLAINAGFDAVDIINKLRAKHHKDAAHGKWWGVDIVNEGICDTYESAVWEPALIKLNSITAATEAACLILCVDETVKNPKAGGNPADDMPAPGPRGGGMRGRGRGGMMRR